MSVKYLILLLLCGPALADVTEDATSNFLRDGAEDPAEFSHVGGASPEGVVCGAVNAVFNVQNVVSMTYGGDAMTEVVDLVGSGSAGAEKRAELFFLGTSVPAGTVTVSADMNGTTNSIQLGCVSLDASGDLEVIDFDEATILGDTTPSLTMQVSGRNSMSFAAISSSENLEGDVTLGAGLTLVASYLSGNVGLIVRQTTSGTSDFTIGITTGPSPADDTNIAAIAVAEVVAGATKARRRMMMQDRL